MVNVIAAGSLFLSLLATTAAPAAASDDEELAAPSGVSVEVVTVNGSGCPAGAAAAVLSADRNAIQLISPAYFAAAGGDTAATDFRKNCQVALQVNKPAGVTFAVTRAAASGFAYLVKGVTATSRTSVYFQGQSATGVAARSFSGPIADEWQSNDAVSPVAYAPCGEQRYLNINTELRVTPSNADDLSSFIVRDPQSTYRLAWKKC